MKKLYNNLFQIILTSICIFPFIFIIFIALYLHNKIPIATEDVWMKKEVTMLGRKGIMHINVTNAKIDYKKYTTHFEDNPDGGYIMILVGCIDNECQATFDITRFIPNENEDFSKPTADELELEFALDTIFKEKLQ